MLTGSASLFVIVFTLVNILACVWLMWWTSKKRDAEETTDSSGGVAKTGHVWDGDLEEYNNPLPRWWLGLFLITIVFSLAYLVIYPGLGNFDGIKGWSMYSAYEREMQAQQARLEERLSQVKDKTLRELATDESAMSMARNLFANNCSTCHGSDARGAKGFPNLTDDDWLWGGSEEAVLETIANGRRGVMPGWAAALGDQGVNEVASYVVSLSGRDAPKDWVSAGEKHFAAMCAACHGVDGKGNQLLGAPNLTDNVWLYGGDFESIRTTVANGRDNEMPAHAPLLGDMKVRLLAAYVLSLNPSRDSGKDSGFDVKENAELSKAETQTADPAGATSTTENEASG